MTTTTTKYEDLPLEDIINNYKHGSGWGKDKDE